MTWLTLKRLVYSKSFWSLNLLLVVVPFLARIAPEISIDLVVLYFAAWFLLIAGALFAIYVPDIMRYENFGDFCRNGGHPDYLTALYKKESIPVAADGEAHIQLENKAGAQNPSYAAFAVVYSHFDISKICARRIITALIAIAMLAVVGVNVYRAGIVLGYGSQHGIIFELKRRMAMKGDHFVGLRAGDKVDVESDNGKGGTIIVGGKVLSPDDGGALVLETGEGSIVRIPKPRIIIIKGKPTK